ncbi:putative inactive deoxyuridine 5'-triphosphate nucleotidohydrolase-like protein FLJ16323, partial [Nomascus leucogenys]|uniref:putative inactive deoxyuridine 5'-triphosphate nucleotidohydrolase-like protein FLJ16323 n=1 Tax=Nomascus leucogenys TaxID=61853 RepID=UPI00122D574A
ETLPPGHTTTIPVNWMLKSPPGHFRLLLLLRQQARNGVTVLAGVTDPEYQDEISLLLHNKGHLKEKMEGARLGLPGRGESLEHQVQSHLNMIAQSQRTFQKKGARKDIILSKLTQEQKTKHFMFLSTFRVVQCMTKFDIDMKESLEKEDASSREKVLEIWKEKNFVAFKKEKVYSEDLECRINGNYQRARSSLLSNTE